jgi:hypothetical protein
MVKINKYIYYLLENCINEIKKIEYEINIKECKY